MITDMRLARAVFGACLVACGRAELAAPPADEALIPECAPGSPDVVYPLGGGNVKRLAADGSVIFAGLSHASAPSASVVMVSSRERSARTLVADAAGFALQGEFLLTVLDGKLVRVAVSDGHTDTLANVGPNPVGIPVVDGERIAMIRGGSKYELLVFDAPGPVSRVLPLPMPKKDYVRRLRMQGDAAYLLAQSLWQMSVVSGTAKILVADAADWRDFEVAESGLYALQSKQAEWPPSANDDPLTFVRRLPLEGGQAEELAVSDGVGELVLMDDEHIYWSARRSEFWDRFGWVFRAPLAGGSSGEVFAGVVRDAHLAQDKTCLYLAWSSTIVRHSK